MFVEAFRLSLSLYLYSRSHSLRLLYRSFIPVQVLYFHKTCGIMTKLLWWMIRRMIGSWYGEGGAE